MSNHNVLRQRSRDFTAERRVISSDNDADSGKPTSTDTGSVKKPSKKSSQSKNYSRSWTVVTILLSTLFLSFILFSRLDWTTIQQHLYKSNTTSDPEQYEHNTFQLHPENHLTRPATTIHHKWTITADLRRPDGVLKRVYLINNLFPGPTLEFRSGDRVQIEVTNSMLNQSVSIHWHGLAMQGANAMDGATGITQDGLEPGASFTYDFSIGDDEAGTFWYHAHDGVQRADGLYGGLVVHDPKRSDADDGPVDEELLVLIGDWYHRAGEEAHEFFSHPGAFGNEAVPDSILVQGVGAFNCSDAVPARPVDCVPRAPEDLPVLHVDRGKRTKLRVVNVGSYAGLELSLDSARLRPISVDGGNEVDAVSAQRISYLYPGERVDVLVEPLDDKAHGLLAVTLEQEWFKYENPALTPTHYFPIRYSGVSSDSISKPPHQDHLDLTTLTCASQIQPALPSRADQIVLLYTMTQKLSRLENIPLGFINHTTWSPQTPAIASLPREAWDKNQLVPHVPLHTWTDVVLNNLDEEPHPFHLHGHSFYVLSTYSSDYNWGSYNPYDFEVDGGASNGAAESASMPPGGAFNLGNPVLKDTVMVPRRGYAVLRFWTGNPGLWMFHCHVLWHQASGMAMAIEVA